MTICPVGGPFFFSYMNYKFYVVNFQEKFLPGPGFEPVTPASRAGTLTESPRRITGPS